LQAELDQRRRLVRVVELRVDGVRMPGEAEELLRLDLLDDRAPAHVLVAGIGDLAFRRLSGDEGTLEPDPEPGTELAVVADRPPHARRRGPELDALLDAIVHMATSKLHIRRPAAKMQPRGCMSRAFTASETLR